jgi:hypothetical protein
MITPGSANPLLLAGGASAGFQVSRSLRFSAPDSAYLSRNFSSGNQKIWTWSAWIKRGKLGSEFRFFDAHSGGSQQYIKFNSSDNLRVLDSNGTLITSQVFRDPSAWYHVLVAFDTTQSTPSNRIKLYVNGSRVTAFSSESYPTQDSDILFNSAVTHSISWSAGTTEYFDGYLANIHFIDGQQLTPSSFTEVSATTGQLIPKTYSGGSYGTNGFYLKFDDNSTTAALGTDSSGNGNTWTTNNFSVTAGAGNDSMVDTPTSISATDTGVGNEIRGNYCTLNPLDKNPACVLSNGNLDNITNINNWSGGAKGTIGMSSGKWYFEVNAVYDTMLGIGNAASSLATPAFPGYSPGSYGYYHNGNKFYNNVSSAYGATYGPGDVIGIAFDADNLTLTYYKNGVSQGVAFSSIPSGTYFPYVATYTSISCNFGQRAFAYTAPSGFKALCDTNLPTPVVAKPDQVFQTKLYTGTGSTQSITGLAFSPNLLWFKNRSDANSHVLFDTVRGRSYGLSSNETVGDVTSDAGNDLASFDSSGFTVGPVQNWNSPNRNGQSLVAWAWDAGEGSAVSNTAGSITSQVRANPTAGFSVVTYTGNSTNGATVGHGLGVTPSMIILKSRSLSPSNWVVTHVSFANQNNNYLSLNETSAINTLTGVWSKSSTTFGFPTSYDGTNLSGQTFVAYCFAPVAGYSSFGSYTGNGSADGPFVFCNFRPRWIMIKGNMTSNWMLVDTSRAEYNAVSKKLYPNVSLAENGDSGETDTTNLVDHLSNGFKLRSTNTYTNQSSTTYVFAAFAESPFQYARAR